MNRQFAALLPTAVAGALAVAACGDDAEEPTQANGRSAAGEVLEGSVSDEMLPYDRLRSQPPLAEMVDGEVVERQEGEGAAPRAGTADLPAPPDGTAEAAPGEAALPDAD